MKKSCLYYYDLKHLFGGWLIAIDHAIQNSIDSVDILEVIRNKYSVDPLNNIDSNRESFLVYCTNDKSNSDENNEKKENFEDLRPERPDLR